MKLRPVPIMVAAALIAGCGSTFTSPPTATTDSPMERPSTATGSPVAVAESLHIAWSEVPFEGSVGAMAGDGSRFVAVGSVSDGATSWTSSDGIAWERHEVPEQSFGEIDPGVKLTAGMGRLIRLGDTLYSFGGAQFMDAVLFAAWRWTDGGAWEVIESGSEFFAGGRVTAVTASDEALLAVRISFAVGYEAPIAPGCGRPTRAGSRPGLRRPMTKTSRFRTSLGTQAGTSRWATARSDGMTPTLMSGHGRRRSGSRRTGKTGPLSSRPKVCRASAP